LEPPDIVVGGVGRGVCAPGDAPFVIGVDRDNLSGVERHYLTAPGRVRYHADQLLSDQIEEGRQGVEFVLSILRAFEGQEFLHPLLRAIVSSLPAEDELMHIVDKVIDSSGVLVGEYGSVEAQEARKALVTGWDTYDREAVRAFAARFIKSADNQLAMERRRADRLVALRKIEYED
jgi:hypothetical protein